MSLKLNHSRDYHNLLDTVVDNESTQNISTSESLWKKMGDQLEIESIPKQDFSVIIRKDIEEQLWQLHFQYIPREEFHWAPGTWWRYVKVQGWSNPDYARNVTADSTGSLDNSSINTKNYKMLLLCDNIIDVCRNIKEKSKNCDELEIIFGKKDMDEFYRQRNIMIDNIKNAIDNKTKIPKNTELFLLECLATVLGNTHKCGEIHQQIIIMHMKEQGKFLTQKQATKFQNGGRQSQLYLLKPTDRDFAQYEGYTGTRCDNCMGFRVKLKQDHTNQWECFDCDNVIPPQHIPKCSYCQIPLYKERLQHVVKTGECKNCNQPIDLPQTLIDQAKS